MPPLSKMEQALPCYGTLSNATTNNSKSYLSTLPLLSIGIISYSDRHGFSVQLCDQFIVQ